MQTDKTRCWLTRPAMPLEWSIYPTTQSVNRKSSFSDNEQLHGSVLYTSIAAASPPPAR